MRTTGRAAEVMAVPKEEVPIIDLVILCKIIIILLFIKIPMF
jgi:hypothetical protein